MNEEEFHKAVDLEQEYCKNQTTIQLVDRIVMSLENGEELNTKSACALATAYELQDRIKSKK